MPTEHNPSDFINRNSPNTYTHTPPQTPPTGKQAESLQPAGLVRVFGTVCA